jgi:hypothetical protein
VLWIRNLSLHLAAKAGSSFMAWSMTVKTSEHQWKDEVVRQELANLGPRRRRQALLGQSWDGRSIAVSDSILGNAYICVG